MRLLSFGVRRKAKKMGVAYTFLFMHADGEQLHKIAGLVESGAVKPVVDRVFPFSATAEALAHVATGRTKGKVVISMQ